MTTSTEYARQNGLAEITATVSELLEAAEGRPVIVPTVAGDPVLLRLATIEEVVGRGDVGESLARQLVRPLP